MHSDSALLLIGRLYAKVYDQSMDSDAAEHLHHLLSNIHDTTAIDEAIYAYQGEILGILLDSVNQSDSLELYTASTSQRESLNLAIIALEDTPQSTAALDAIAQLAQVEPPAPGQAKIDIPTENLSSDARKLSALGLHQGIAISVPHLGIPILEGDETTDISTSSTVLGEQRYASAKAVPKWLTHLSETPSAGFVTYQNSQGETLQVKFNAKGNYFPLWG
ncbi:hypothetical protein [Corynebacterium kefirresidentii]|uniref:hypothetical protein n=1 Tax=Corynebacterium kefirresidentii TaxID=1979527 RepID=UPI000A38E410|nr:hypothetical protein [Corynebacterium kefirresidentii]OUJ21563.1 hypothetical protein CBI45_12035 [Corynebacterium kefirresidentii]